MGMGGAHTAIARVAKHHETIEDAINHYANPDTSVSVTFDMGHQSFCSANIGYPVARGRFVLDHPMDFSAAAGDRLVGTVPMFFDFGRVAGKEAAYAEQGVERGTGLLYETVNDDIHKMLSVTGTEQLEAVSLGRCEAEQGAAARQQDRQGALADRNVCFFYFGKDSDFAKFPVDPNTIMLCRANDGTFKSFTIAALRESLGLDADNHAAMAVAALLAGSDYVDVTKRRLLITSSKLVVEAIKGLPAEEQRNPVVIIDKVIPIAHKRGFLMDEPDVCIEALQRAYVLEMCAWVPAEGGGLRRLSPVPAGLEELEAEANPRPPFTDEQLKLVHEGRFDPNLCITREPRPHPSIDHAWSVYTGPPEDFLLLSSSGTDRDIREVERMQALAGHFERAVTQYKADHPGENFALLGSSGGIYVPQPWVATADPSLREYLDGKPGSRSYVSVRHYLLKLLQFLEPEAREALAGELFKRGSRGVGGRRAGFVRLVDKFIDEHGDERGMLFLGHLNTKPAGPIWPRLEAHAAQIPRGSDLGAVRGMKATTMVKLLYWWRTSSDDIEAAEEAIAALVAKSRAKQGLLPDETVDAAGHREFAELLKQVLTTRNLDIVPTTQPKDAAAWADFIALIPGTKFLVDQLKAAPSMSSMAGFYYKNRKVIDAHLAGWRKRRAEDLAALGHDAVGRTIKRRRKADRANGKGAVPTATIVSYNEETKLHTLFFKKKGEEEHDLSEP